MMKRMMIFALMELFYSFAMANEIIEKDIQGAPFQNVRQTKVYYVVMGSYATLEEAKQWNYFCPDGLEANIYQAVVNGKTVYRACVGCYYSKKNAKKQVALIRLYYTNDVWIWTSNGLAKCVFQGTAPSGELIPVTPQ